MNKPEEDEIVCPECGSENFVAHKYECECFECGYSNEADCDEILEARDEANEDKYND